jgi:membrane protein implicated in regulation of membrane protease activity
VVDAAGGGVHLGILFVFFRTEFGVATPCRMVMRGGGWKAEAVFFLALSVFSLCGRRCYRHQGS